MLLINNLSNFIVLETQSIRDSLEKISLNKAGFVVVVQKNGKLIGTLTDGDIRRFLINTDHADLNKENLLITNKNAKFSFEGAEIREVKIILEQFNFCPLVDKNKILLGIYCKKTNHIQIENKFISNEHPCFIISEIGNNHNGSMELAKKLIDLSITAGADCVKFQMRNMSKLYKFRNDSSEDLGAQYTLDLLDKFQLKNEQLLELFDYCKSLGSIPLCTPWDEDSLAVLEDYGMPAYKVASADMTNHIFLEKILKTNKPLIISTGMSSEQNIIDTISLLEKYESAYILLHCNSTYPAPFSDINLNYLNRLKELSKRPVGYSGHERGKAVSMAAVAMGAKVLERHFTIEKTMEGNDHKVSLLPSEFKSLVSGIREIETSLGTSVGRSISQGELMNKEVLGKSLYFLNNVSSGEKFKSEDFGVTSPGKGLQPIDLKNIVGQTASKDFYEGDFIYSEDLTNLNYTKKPWSFKLKYGLPVRYHDFHDLYENSNFDIVEFHLSYQDLDLDISKYLKGKYPQQLVVHCPELYKNDHILNLVADSPDYLSLSRKNLERTIEETLKLKEFFPNSTKPLLITNVGGFSEYEFKTKEWRERKYKKLAEILNQYKDSGIEIIPQTMPPYPWHFGGQRFHNLFVQINEICEFCEKYDFRICLDISHTKLATHKFKESFTDSISKLAPLTAHLHIADARGTSGEGLQIGDGEIAFSSIWPKIEKLYKDASFVPEVWQGHKNNGSGFWQACDKLVEFK